MNRDPFQAKGTAGSPNDTQKEYPVCDRCGSPNVSADAAARWNHEKQNWSVTNVFDKGHSCDDCEGECRIEWKEGDPPEEETDNMQRARELLAAEYERDGHVYTAALLRKDVHPIGANDYRALRAIAAALSQQPGAISSSRTLNQSPSQDNAMNETLPEAVVIAAKQAAYATNPDTVLSLASTRAALYAARSAGLTVACGGCLHQGDGEVEYEYEVWQDNSLQAGGSTSDYATAKSSADHYAMMYGQDGPVEVRMYVKRQIISPPSAPETEENVAADSYHYLAELLEPYVAREGSNPNGPFPASVVESFQMLLEHWKATRTAPPSAPVGVEGTWLWCKLMDWCREQRIAPATQDKLFAIAGEAHRLNALAQQPAAVDGAMLERALIADAREYGASIPESRARRLLAAALAQQPTTESKCDHCGGFGEVTGEYPGVACPKCRGTGLAQQPAAVDEFVTIDGRRYDVDTVRTALLGLASDLVAQPEGDRHDVR